MKNKEIYINKFIYQLKNYTSEHNTMIDILISKYNKDPFIILISCVLSARAKDKNTIHILESLFKHAKTPTKLLEMDLNELKKIIRPIGMQNIKAQTIKKISEKIINDFYGIVPKEQIELLKIKGIGRKTSSLILSKSFDIPAITVDTHVYRLAKRFGLSNQKNILKVEIDLKKIFPKTKWIELSDNLVIYGQNICDSKKYDISKCKCDGKCIELCNLAKKIISI